MTDPKENLLPCPFCGGGVEIDKVDEEHCRNVKIYSAVHCAECGQWFFKGMSEEKAIAAWNRRAVHPHLAQRVIELEAENAKLRETVVEWNDVGEAIMDAVVGRKAPLSDSDVIGEVARLRYENAKLRAVAEVAKHFYGICFDMPIDFPSAGPFVWGMGDLKDALAAAGYGGEE